MQLKLWSGQLQFMERHQAHVDKAQTFFLAAKVAKTGIYPVVNDF